MKSNRNLWVALIAVAIIALGGYVFPSMKAVLGANPTDFDATNFSKLTASNGFSVGTSQQFVVSSAGAVTNTSTGTTTVGVTTTSTTKGICFNVNATSSNTAVNMTFAASTTAISTVGIVPVLRYGTCP